MEALSRLLRDEYAPHEPRADLKLTGSLPRGHVALGMLRKLGLRSKPPASLPKRGRPDQRDGNRLFGAARVWSRRVAQTGRIMRKMSRQNEPDRCAVRPSY
jgi:hypothetical protein